MRPGVIVTIAALLVMGAVVPAMAQGGSNTDYEEWYNDDGEFCCWISEVYNDNNDFVGYDFLFESHDDNGNFEGYDEYVGVYEEVGAWTFLWYDWYILDADMNDLDHIEQVYTENFELYEDGGSTQTGGGSTQTGGGTAPPPAPAAGLVDLPPLFLSNPQSTTVAGEGTSYTLRLSTADFVVVDDGAAEPTIACTAVGTSATLSGTPTVWDLGAGANNIQCTATDGGGKTSSISYTITVTLEEQEAGLFASDSHAYRFDRIMRLHGPALSDAHIMKFIKYYHTAGAVVFDIIDNNGVGPIPDHPTCSAANTEAQLLAKLRTGTDDQKRHCLALLAENGAFRSVSLGF